MDPWPIVMRARLESGTLRLNRSVLRQLLAGRKDAELVVTIERKHATRSVLANAYYWGVVIEHLSDHTGYTPDEMHEVCKAKFIPKKLALVDGNGEVKDELVIGGTTTTMNKIQFGEYIEAIRHWAAADLGVVIPDA